MKKLLSTAAVAIITLSSINASEPLTIGNLIHSLETMGNYQGAAQFTVSMPQMPEDVVYTIKLESHTPQCADSLSPCDYIIDWAINNQQSKAQGFSAYYSGNHYRYNGGGRLQEYHFQTDPLPFIDRHEPGRYMPGVQKAAQFVGYLPAFIGADIRRWSADSTHTFHLAADTIVSGIHHVALTARRIVDDATVQEMEYLFDIATLRPQRVVFENNPGSLSEQTVTIVYDPTAEPSDTIETIDEDRLMATYPEVFERYRQSNFHIENLVGDYLPAFSLPSATGERYSRSRKDPFRAPAVVLFYEPGQGFATEAVEAVRSATEQLPYNAAVIFVALSSNIDRVEETIGSERIGEASLISGAGFARDCGVATTPVVIIAESSGKVANVIIGFNKTLESDVIEKMIGLK